MAGVAWGVAIIPQKNYSSSVIGRNDPCPCGSGKKYKKCCLESEASAQAGKASPDLWSQWEEPAGPTLKDLWTLSKVACLETTDIVTRLEKLGIDGCQASFVRLADARTSALSIGRVWIGELTMPPGTWEEDFICVAACELWKRYCPERPSAEMVDDWVTQGYQLCEAHKGGEAVDVWLRLWEHVRLKIEPSMTTYSDADAVFEISQFFGNWIQDLIMEIGNTSIRDNKYTEIGIRLIRELLDQFVDESLNAILNLRCDLGNLLFRADRPKEGETALLTIINEHPDQSCGYAYLSDELGRSKQANADIPRAITLLEQALAYPVIDAVDWDLEYRLAALRDPLAGAR